MYGRGSGFKIKRSEVTEGPDGEPISREVVKQQLKIEQDESEEDALIDFKIQMAREHVEDLTGLSLITQTRVIKLDCFPYCDTIALTHGPIQEVTSVQYYGVNDELQTLSASDYWFHQSASEGSIQIKNTWPATGTRKGAVVITYVAGFGDGGEDVPMKLREAILVVLTWLFENRDAPVPANLVDALIGSYITTQDVSY